MAKSFEHLLQKRDEARDEYLRTQQEKGPTAHLHRHDAARAFESAELELRKAFEAKAAEEPAISADKTKSSKPDVEAEVEAPSWAIWDVVRGKLCDIVGDGFSSRSMLPAIDRVERIIADLRRKAGIPEQRPALPGDVIDLLSNIQTADPRLRAEIDAILAREACECRDPCSDNTCPSFMARRATPVPWQAIVATLDELLKWHHARLSAVTDIGVCNADRNAEAAKRAVLAYMNGVPSLDVFREAFGAALFQAALSRPELEPLLTKTESIADDLHARIVHAQSRRAIGLTA